jgi:23S rRNA G2445 N2-methylase RlmL
MAREKYAREGGSVTVPARMAARKGAGRDRDLGRRVREAGFTPSVRDVPAIVALLDSEDEELARDAERALVRVGPTLVPAVREEAKRATPAARTRLVRAVGALVGRSSGTESEAGAADEERPAVAWLIEELGRTGGSLKAVRYAAAALGKVRHDADVAEAALLAAWGAATERGGPIELLRVLADALGKVGTGRVVSALGACHAEDPELKRLVGRALLRVERSLARSEVSTIDGDASLDRPWPIVFRCRAGLESILVAELGKKQAPRAVEEGRVEAVFRGPLSGAFAARTALSFALLLGPASGTDEATLAGDLLSSESAWRIFRAFTRGPIRFRLAFEAGGHRRGLVHRVAERLRTTRPEVMNDPTGSSWEALVREHGELGVGERTGRTMTIDLEPRALRDERFSYRVSDVPAASHPTIAAALARVAEARPDDVVWDPFVGSALELIERARLGPYASLHGTDIEEGALEAARANLARAGIDRVELTHADSTAPRDADKVPRGVTLVLTNPPMGRRVARGELAPLLDRFVHTVAGALVAGGRLVWLSPMPERTRARLESAGFTIDAARPVDIGGFRAELQRATKR